MHTIELGKITIEVVLKDIENIHLSVYPPKGAVRIAAPDRMDLDTIRVFALSKLRWIKKQRASFENQARETERELLSRESHYYRGERYLLKVIEADAKPKVILKTKSIELYVRPQASADKKKVVLDEWYRSQLKQTIPPMIAKWEKEMGVQCNDFGVRRMKTKWGTCNIEAKRIWLNLELAKKPLICLEYIVVHELVHLLERNHNDRFVAYMDRFMPQWRSHRKELNRLPYGYVDWKY